MNSFLIRGICPNLTNFSRLIRLSVSHNAGKPAAPTTLLLCMLQVVEVFCSRYSQLDGRSKEQLLVSLAR